ncbi:MAG: hypothetical protein V6D39_21630 [Dolichospermum lemmermannii FEM_B0920]
MALVKSVRGDSGKPVELVRMPVEIKAVKLLFKELVLAIKLLE